MKDPKSLRLRSSSDLDGSQGRLALALTVHAAGAHPQVSETGAPGLLAHPERLLARGGARSGKSPPTLLFLQGNPRPPSLSLREGSSRPSNQPEGGNPRPSRRLGGSLAQRGEEWTPAPVRAGPGQRDAAGRRLQAAEEPQAEPRAPGLRLPRLPANRGFAARGRRGGGTGGGRGGGSCAGTRRVAPGSGRARKPREPRPSREQVKRPSRCSRDAPAPGVNEPREGHTATAGGILHSCVTCMGPAVK
nr:uncharacterized protein LOC112425095 [Macaca nemestrina]